MPYKAKTFKVGEKIGYENFENISTGVVTEIDPDFGCAIEWDDGFKDEPGDGRFYSMHELLKL